LCDVLERAAAALGSRKSTFADSYSLRAAMRREENAIRDAFGRMADVAGLTDAERSVLVGDARDLSRVILALEILGAALDLLGRPAAAAAWLRRENPDELFLCRSPLRLMGANGRLGAEITLLHLRARLRAAGMAPIPGRVQSASPRST
jgi:hypothetical protein